VIVDGEDIFGDGVNVAARLQEIAERGGVCISEKVQAEVRGKLGVEFEDGGAQALKNVTDPVRVWRWSPSQVEASGAVTETRAGEPLPLPHKPSIAVLPFENMSGDPEQEYFSDGIAEDIITALSRVHWLFVIARNSSFTYKGQAIDVTQVARDLGVRYVVEGSVRKAGSRVRVTAQLIDATSGNHLWADRYDRELDDIFAIQDEITETIVGNIDNELRVSERDRAQRKPPASLDAWDLYQRGMWHVYKYTKEDNEEAHRLFRDATERDPSFPLPHAGLAYISYLDVFFGYADDPTCTLAEGLQSGERAVALDDRDAFTHFGLGRIATLLGKHDLAIAELGRAVDLNPSFAHAHYALGFAFLWAGRAAEGIPNSNTAIRLSPHDRTIWAYRMLIAWCHFQLGNYEDAQRSAREAVRARTQEFWPHAVLAVVLAELDKLEEARAAIEEMRRLNPRVSMSLFERATQSQDAGTREKFIDGLRKAGLPE
jgi:adenylate cyclase